MTDKEWFSHMYKQFIRYNGTKGVYIMCHPDDYLRVLDMQVGIEIKTYDCLERGNVILAKSGRKLKSWP